MTDPLFRRTHRTLPLAAVAAVARCELPAGADPTLPIVALAPLVTAGAGALAMADGAVALDDLRGTRASACIVAPHRRADVPAGTIALVSDDPLRAFRHVAPTIDPASVRPSSWPEPAALHATAFVHAEARLEPGVLIGPGVIVGPGAEIGAGTTIGAGTFIDADVCIGRGCAIDAHVSVTHALVGDRVVLHVGARIGVLEAGAPRLGRTILQDDVEIGTNAIVMRGGMADTIVGEAAVVAAAAIVATDAIVARHASISRGAPAAPVQPVEPSADVSSVGKIV